MHVVDGTQDDDCFVSQVFETITKQKCRDDGSNQSLSPVFS